MSTTIAKQFVNSFAVALSVGIHSNIIRYCERSNQLNYGSANSMSPAQPGGRASRKGTTIEKRWIRQA